MKIQKLRFIDIQYHHCAYPSTLKESIKRIALSFPIKVRQEGDEFICVDGHKRMSAIHDILQEQNANTKLDMIPVIIINDVRTANSWTIMNHH